MKNTLLLFLYFLLLINGPLSAQIDSLTYQRYRLMYKYVAKQLNQNREVMNWVIYKEQDSSDIGCLLLEVQDELIPFSETKVSFVFHTKELEKQLEACGQNRDSLMRYEFSKENTYLRTKELKRLSLSNHSFFKLYYSRPFQNVYICELMRAKHPEYGEDYTDMNDFNNVCIFCFVFDEALDIRCVECKCVTYE